MSYHKDDEAHDHQKFILIILNKINILAAIDRQATLAISFTSGQIEKRIGKLAGR